MLLRLAWLGPCSFLLACGPSFYAQRVNGLYESRPDDCEIRFENIPAADAMAKYDHIGMVTITGSGSNDFTPELKERVRQEACKLGGQVVTFNASNDAGMVGMSQFMVFRDKASVEAPAAGDSAI